MNRSTIHTSVFQFDRQIIPIFKVNSVFLEFFNEFLVRNHLIMKSEVCLSYLRYTAKQNYNREFSLQNIAPLMKTNSITADTFRTVSESSVFEAKMIFYSIKCHL